MSSKDEKLNLNISLKNNYILYITIILVFIGIILFLYFFSTEEPLKILNEMNNEKYHI
jgi:hypothetical protein